MSINLSNIAVLNINGVDYCCVIKGISKSEVINLLQKADLNEKRGTLQNIIFFIMYKKLVNKL